MLLRIALRDLWWHDEALGCLRVTLRGLRVILRRLRVTLRGLRITLDWLGITLWLLAILRGIHLCTRVLLGRNTWIYRWLLHLGIPIVSLNVLWHGLLHLSIEEIWLLHIARGCHGLGLHICPCQGDLVHLLPDLSPSFPEKFKFDTIASLG